MFILSVLVVSCKDKSSEPDKESVLLSAIHQEADIVTTELTIQTRQKRFRYATQILGNLGAENVLFQCR